MTGDPATVSSVLVAVGTAGHWTMALHFLEKGHVIQRLQLDDITFAATWTNVEKCEHVGKTKLSKCFAENNLYQSMQIQFMTMVQYFGDPVRPMILGKTGRFSPWIGIACPFVIHEKHVIQCWSRAFVSILS